MYETYRALFDRISHEAVTKSEHGKDEDKIKFVSKIAELKKYSYYGFISEADIKVVKTLEKCLGECELNAK